MNKQNRQTTKKVKQMQAAARAAEQRRRNLLVGGIAIAVIIVVVGIGILVQQTRDDTGSGSAAPAGVTDTYGIMRGDDSAPVTVTIYEDFQCPFCAEFEAALGETLTKNVDEGTIKIDYRPLAFLDDATTTDYSSRALETAACTLDDGGVDAYVALHDLLFTNQPSEGTAGLSDAELAGWLSRRAHRRVQSKAASRQALSTLGSRLPRTKPRKMGCHRLRRTS
jgi:protein-disulfide isomerase